MSIGSPSFRRAAATARAVVNNRTDIAHSSSAQRGNGACTAETIPRAKTAANAHRLQSGKSAQASAKSILALDAVNTSTSRLMATS